MYVELLLGFAVLLAYFLYKLLLAPQKDYWSKYGVRQIDTSVAVSSLDMFLGRKGFGDADDYAVSQLGKSEKFCGFLESGKPILVIKDMELIKRVLIKDFDHFVDRRAFFTKEDGIFGQMLVNLEGEEWKGVRSAVSPTFTTGKIRRMMEIFNSVGHEWVNEFTKKAKLSSGTIDLVSSVNQYTLDVISTAVFGMKTDAITNPNSKFSEMANRLTDFTKFKTSCKMALKIMFPRFCTKLNIKPIESTPMTFFEEILNQGLQARLSGQIKRNDFLQLMVEAKKGELEAVGNDELDSFEKDAQISDKVESNKKQWLTNEVMNAQCVLFFFAGFSTTTNLIVFMMYAMALHQNVQEKLRKELKKIVKEDGSFDYDDVNQLVYLDMVMCETLRKFPGGTRIERLCVREYKDPENGLTVPKGTIVGIPLNSIHHSKDYYENPDKFDPEHFTPEKKSSRNPYAYMPFGMGPRNCIGMRFAQTEVKSAIAHIVHNFLIEPTATTPVPLQGQCVGFALVPPKGLEVKLIPIAN